MALGAELELTGTGGRRRLPLELFFLAPGKSALRNDELITDVILPQPRPGTGSAFAKIGRVSNDIAKASCAVVLVRDGNRVVECRLAFGSVAPTPVRTLKAEQLLIGETWGAELVEQAAAAAAAEITPVDDVRSTAWYRREIVRVMAADALRLAWQRASHGDTATLPAWTTTAEGLQTAQVTGQHGSVPHWARRRGR